MTTPPDPAACPMSSPANIPDLRGADDLRAEFPGWTIDVSFDGDRPLWRASREAGRGGPPHLVAASCGEMRALLDEADAVDCRHAIVALRDALRALGLTAEVYGLTVHTETRVGILRAVAARRGVFAWTSGVELGPTGAPDAVAEQMLPGLGLS